EGTQYESYRTMGAHPIECQGIPGVRFAVWAPNAEVVSVIGDFNDWDERRHPMRLRSSGVWEIFLPGVGAGTNYKYSVRAPSRGFHQQKADPYGFAMEVPPQSASIVTNLDTYQWNDREWMDARAHKDPLKQPVSIYEVHLGSWLRGPEYLSQLPRARGQAGRVCRPARLYAFGIAARDGASLLRVMGISSGGLLCPHIALRPAAGLHVFRRSLPSGRRRRHRRLGAGSFSQGCTRAGVL